MGGRYWDKYSHIAHVMCIYRMRMGVVGAFRKAWSRTNDFCNIVYIPS